MPCQAQQLRAAAAAAAGAVVLAASDALAAVLLPAVHQQGGVGLQKQTVAYFSRQQRLP